MSTTEKQVTVLAATVILKMKLIQSQRSKLRCLICMLDENPKTF